MLSNVLYDFLITRVPITDKVDPDNIQLWPIDLNVIDYSILAFRQTANDEQVLLNGGTGLNTESISFICVSKSPQNTLELAQAVELDLVGFIGNIGSIECMGVQKLGFSDEFDEETGAHVGLLSLNFFTRGA